MCAESHFTVTSVCPHHPFPLLKWLMEVLQEEKKPEDEIQETSWGKTQWNELI